MSNESEDEATQVQGNIITNIDEEVNEEVNDVVTHWNIVMKKVEKGQLKGQEIKHFYCKYCSKSFQGPSSGTILKHLRISKEKMTNQLKIWFVFLKFIAFKNIYFYLN